METFQVVQFEKNNTGDAVCKEIFHRSQNSKNKNKSIRTGRVVKKSRVKKKNTSASEDNIRNDIVNSVDRRTILKHSDIKNKTTSLKKRSKNRLTSKQINKTLPRKVPLKNNIDIKSNGKIKQTAKFSKAKKRNKRHSSIEKNANTPPVELNKEDTSKQRKQEKLKDMLRETIKRHPLTPKQKQGMSLREKMMEKLQAARFRYINEQIYSSPSKEAQKFFSKDPESFRAYHEGYKQQVNKWPLNPLTVIIKSIQKLPKTHVIADFGCGDATLAKSVQNKVHSFDLVATNELVTACDMAHVPLQSNSVDVVVFCLSLMGTNLHDYILEANRVLKLGGILKIAEVESRFDEVQQFIEGLKKFNFKTTWKDLSHNLFYFLDFRKESNIKKKKNLPIITLNPCLYKKR